MDLLQAIKERHSVRRYTTQPIPQDIVEKLQAAVKQCNEESGLHIQLVLNEPKAFDSFMARYGHFENCSNYLAMVGKKSAKLDETVGYYGEKLVLIAQQLGLNSCWVGLTYKKGQARYQIDKGETLACVIAIGYGQNSGHPHKGKTIEQVAPGQYEEWFIHGVEAALLAPTAVNQQKFFISEKEGKVVAKAGLGFYAKMDLGIVKYHFEVGAGRKIDWA